MPPAFTLGGGYTGSLTTINHAGVNLTAMYTDGVPRAVGCGDDTQFRLSYAAGPLLAAVAVVHTIHGAGQHFAVANPVPVAGVTPTISDTDSEFGVEGQVTYLGDNFSVEVADGMVEDNWQAGAGVTGNLSDTFSLQLAAGIGMMGDEDLRSFALPVNPYAVDADAEYCVVSGLITVTLSESIAAELGAGYRI